jgi:CTP synthase (UTP-ammonia lyase)
MQMAIIEHAKCIRFVDANSTEMNEHTAHPVVNLMENKKQLLIKVEQCALEHGNATSRKNHWPIKYMVRLFQSVTVTVMSTTAVM